LTNVTGFHSATLVTSLPESSSALAIAQLNGQLYVTVYNVAGVLVYDTQTFQLLRQITFPGFSPIKHGLATSSFNNFLYIGDRSNIKVHRVDLSVTNTVSVVSWTVPSRALGLSATEAGNVLVVSDDRTIREYNPSGSLVRSVTQSNNMWQAIEVSNGAWLVSCRGPMYGLAMVSMNGTVMMSFGSAAGSGIAQVGDAMSIAIDTNGYMFVDDYGNNRILVVDPFFTVSHQLILPVNIALQAPSALSLGSGRLYVGESGGQNRVLVFDIV